MWILLPLSPVPWAIGPVSAVRTNGKMRPFVGANQQLKMYQEGVKEELYAQLPDGFEMFEGKIELRCYFWRRMEEYKTPQARTARNHEADLTNMVKAVEDAMQGVLFKNDRDVDEQHNYIVEQGFDVESKVLIYVGQSDPSTKLTALPIQAHALLYPDLYPAFPGDESSAVLLDDEPVDPDQIELI